MRRRRTLSSHRRPRHRWRSKCARQPRGAAGRNYQAAGQAQPDRQGHGSHERQRAGRHRQRDGQRRFDPARDEDGRHGQQQEGGNDRQVQQPLHQAADDCRGRVPAVGLAHADQPRHFAQAHRQRDQPDCVPGADPQGRAEHVVLGDQMHAQGTEQVPRQQQRQRRPHRRPGKLLRHRRQRSRVEPGGDHSKQRQTDRPGDSPGPGFGPLHRSLRCVHRPVEILSLEIIVVMPELGANRS